MNHHRLKKDYERPQHLQSTYSEECSDTDDINHSASDSNSIESQEPRLDIDGEEDLGPPLDPEPAAVRRQRGRRAPDRYGFGRVNVRTALEDEKAEIQL